MFSIASALCLLLKSNKKCVKGVVRICSSGKALLAASLPIAYSCTSQTVADPFTPHRTICKTALKPYLLRNSGRFF